MAFLTMLSNKRLHNKYKKKFVKVLIVGSMILFDFNCTTWFEMRLWCMYSPTTVSSILSNSRAIATMTRTSWREPRHRIIHVLVASHDDVDFIWSGEMWPVGPPESVDCILLADFYCIEIKKKLLYINMKLSSTID